MLRLNNIFLGFYWLFLFLFFLKTFEIMYERKKENVCIILYQNQNHFYHDKSSKNVAFIIDTTLIVQKLMIFFRDLADVGSS